MNKKYFYIALISTGVSLLNALNIQQEYQRIKDEKISTLYNEIVNLDAKEAQDLAQMFIKQEKIDVQTLEPYSDWLFAHPKSISGNWQTHWNETLLFFNDNIKIYGAYSIKDIPLIKGRPRFSKLIFKSTHFFSINKSINLRKRQEGYYFDGLLVNADNSFCVAQYSYFQHDNNVLFDLINCKSRQTTSLSENVVACCFGSAHQLYTVNNEGLVEVVDLKNNTKKKVIQLYLGVNQQIKGIESNGAGNFIVVPTQHFIFMIHIVGNKVALKVESFPFSPIRTITLNHSGSQMCITINPDNIYSLDMIDEIFLFNRAHPHVFVGLTKEFEGYKSSFVFNKHSQISDISLKWEKDDRLLLAECNYVNKYQSSKIPLGTMGTFIVSQSGNSWHQKALYAYGDLSDLYISPEKKRLTTIYPRDKKIDLTVSQDGRQLILVDKTEWLKKTTLITLYDDVMQEALRYFDVTKEHETNIYKRLLGVMLLHAIFKQSKHAIQLDAVETMVYNTCLPGAIKNILKKSYTISFS